MASGRAAGAACNRACRPGFLGINGAGKTTTLQMCVCVSRLCAEAADVAPPSFRLTADTLPTEGTAFLAGHNILTEQRIVRKKMGA
jgi:hypothetical protein